jgi:hypothetical protein
LDTRDRALIIPGSQDFTLIVHRRHVGCETVGRLRDFVRSFSCTASASAKQDGQTDEQREDDRRRGDEDRPGKS